MIRVFEGNTTGRDFIVGDIHGCFPALEELLRNVKFDEAVDRLFSVGDLIDRGFHSAMALDWLRKPFFHAVRANHEQFAIDWKEGTVTDYLWAINGGAWFFDLTDEKQQEFVDAFLDMPFLIEINTGDVRIGIVHADPVLSDWDELKARIGEERVQTEAIWGRTRITAKLDTDVRNVSAIVCGHTITPDVVQLGNVYYIDTGVFARKKLTMLEIRGEELVQHSVSTAS